MFRKRKAQSTLEYITVFAAIVAAIVVVAYSVLKPAIKNLFEKAAEKINNTATTFAANNTTP